MAHPWGKGRSLRGVLGPCQGSRSRGAVGARRSRRLLSLRDTARAMSLENVEIVRRACGREAIRENLQRFETAWEELEVTAAQFIDAGERVFVTAHFRGRGRASGIPADARFYEIYTLSDRKIVRIDEFTDRNAAFQAAGLSE